MIVLISTIGAELKMTDGGHSHRCQFETPGRYPDQLRTRGFSLRPQEKNMSVSVSRYEKLSGVCAIILSIHRPEPVERA